MRRAFTSEPGHPGPARHGGRRADPGHLRHLHAGHPSHFGYEAPLLPPNDWFWNIPFTAGEFFVPLMFKVHLVMPVLLAIALLAFAWRLVNVPAFADFLIATEAEINKVSWTTRKRLIQDTIVCLVTVFLLTMFLFLVDIMWIKILGSSWIGVLSYDTREVQQKQQEKNQW